MYENSYLPHYQWSAVDLYLTALQPLWGRGRDVSPSLWPKCFPNAISRPTVCVNSILIL